MTTNLGSSPAIRTVQKAITFDGTAGKGAIGNVIYFTITGAVHVVSIDAVCTQDCNVDGGTGAASLSLGVVNATTLFIAATTATTITLANGLWYSTTPNTNGIALPATMKDIAIKQNIVIAVTSSGTQLVNTGTIVLTVHYVPSTSNGLLV